MGRTLSAKEADEHICVGNFERSDWLHCEQQFVQPCSMKDSDRNCIACKRLWHPHTHLVPV